MTPCVLSADVIASNEVNIPFHPLTHVRTSNTERNIAGCYIVVFRFQCRVLNHLQKYLVQY